MEDKQATEHYLNELDNELCAMDRLPILVGEFVKDYIEKHCLDISSKDLKEGLSGLTDTISDMCFSRRCAIVDRIGDVPAPNYTQILLDAVNPTYGEKLLKALNKSTGAI